MQYGPIFAIVAVSFLCSSAVIVQAPTCMTEVWGDGDDDEKESMFS
jgi:hypothetical protein